MGLAVLGTRENYVMVVGADRLDRYETCFHFLGGINPLTEFGVPLLLGDCWVTVEMSNMHLWPSAERADMSAPPSTANRTSSRHLLDMQTGASPSIAGSVMAL